MRPATLQNDTDDIQALLLHYFSVLAQQEKTPKLMAQ